MIMINLKKTFTCLLLATLLFTLGCDNHSPANKNAPLTVAVSIPPQAWLVKQITGEDTNLLTLVQPGESPTTYQPTDEQISTLMHADVLFRTGVPFEHAQWYHAIEKSKHLKIVDQRQNIKLRTMTKHTHQDEHHHDDHHHHATHDPHIWLSPPLLKTQAKTITETLGKLKPAHAEIYNKNYLALCDELDQLDLEIQKNLANLPARTFFVFHPAWGYFAEQYNLVQIAIEIEGKQPTDHELTELQTLARQHNIKVIFVQPQIAGQAASAVAKTINAELKVLDPLAHDIIANLRAVSQVLADSQ